MIKVPKGEEKKKDQIHLFEGEKISRACENITGNEMSRKQTIRAITARKFVKCTNKCERPNDPDGYVWYDFVLFQQLLLFLCKNVSN